MLWINPDACHHPADSPARARIVGAQAGSQRCKQSEQLPGDYVHWRTAIIGEFPGQIQPDHMIGKARRFPDLVGINDYAHGREFLALDFLEQVHLIAAPFWLARKKLNEKSIAVDGRHGPVTKPQR